MASYYEKKKEFELQKLRIMKIRNHSQKSEKVTNISNTTGTDARHTQGGERAWWEQYIIMKYDLLINHAELSP